MKSYFVIGKHVQRIVATPFLGIRFLEGLVEPKTRMAFLDIKDGAYLKMMHHGVIRQETTLWLDLN